MDCNCFDAENNIIYSYNNMFKLCCIEKYLRINDTWNSIPFKIRYQYILDYKNAVSINYDNNIISVHRSYNIKNHKQYHNINTHEQFIFKNIFVIEEWLSIENMNCNLQKQCAEVNYINKELKENNDILLSQLKNIYKQSQISINKCKKIRSKLNKKNNQIINLSNKFKIEANNIDLKDELLKENMNLKCKNDKLNNDLSKKDKLNKRLTNLLTIYKYHELNNVQKYNYQDIKNRNKQLNQEFKRVAKLMKLNV